MTALALQMFGGRIPKLGRQKLGDTAAEIARNCDLQSGDLEGLRAPYIVHRFPEGTEIVRAFRMLANPDFPSDFWVGFETKFTHFVRGTIINDQFERYYWTEEGQPPRYNTRARIEAGDPPYLLGVPRPINAPVVTPTGGDPELEVTRVYLYTFVSEYGEEGAPSDPTIAIGNDDGTWTISGMDTTVPDAADRPAFTKRIYRTVSGRVGTAYYFVAEIPLIDDTYVDTVPTNEVALNEQLQSTSWNEPPENLIGLRAHPNGFMIGFDGNDLYFSEPYRPHAWPIEYTLSTQHPVVETGVFGQSLGVATEAFPYIATGVNPASMTLIKKETPAPCESRYGVVSSPYGVVFTGTDGLMLLGPRGIDNLTEEYIDRETWQREYEPTTINLALYRNFVIGLLDGPDNKGFLISPTTPPGPLTDLLDFAPAFQSVQTDLYDGQFQLLRQNEVYKWDDPIGVPLNYRWKSKQIVTPKPCNFGMYRIDFEPFFRSIADGEFGSLIDEWNENRLDHPLDMLDFATFNDVAVIEGLEPTSVPQIRQPMGGSPLFQKALDIEQYVTVSAYIEDERIYAEVITEPGRYRLPAGFKNDLWSFEFNGNVRLKHFKVAETGKELASI